MGTEVRNQKSEIRWGFATVLVASALAYGDDHSPTPFNRAMTPREFSFPRDHGRHRDYKTEWWYFTGNVKTKTGERFGYQLTFFRVGMTRQSTTRTSQWAADELYFAHFAVTEAGRRKFRYHEQTARNGLSLAGSADDTLNVWLHQWRAQLQSDGSIRLVATADNAAIDLTLEPLRDPILNGNRGLSTKGPDPGQASHYYSIPRCVTRGVVRVGDNHVHNKAREVQVEGLSWMDHEFGTDTMHHDVDGWDWFGLHLDDGTDVMVYSIRLGQTESPQFESATVVHPDGTVQRLAADQVTVAGHGRDESATSPAAYPSRWTVTLVPLDLELFVTPTMRNQELLTPRTTRITYWEGAVTVEGWRKDTPTKGRGYLEMTGYDKPLGKRF